MIATMREPEAGEVPLGIIRTPTPQLRAFVETQKTAMPAADFAAMMGEIHGLYGKYRAALEAASTGVRRAQALHRMMEGAVATASGLTVSCQKGCCGCCHFEVEIFGYEAEVLRDCVNGGVAVDRSRLEIQSSRERKSPEWLKFWSRDNRCVFLGEDGACRVYEDRPAACRRLLVTTPPEACTTLGAAVAPVQILLAEILLSAALDLDPKGHASISKMLMPLLTA